MSAIYHGQDITEQPASFTTKEDKSGTTIRVFMGKEANIKAKANELNAQGYSVLVDEGPAPAWTLTANIAYNIIDNQLPETQWNIQTLEGQQNLLESNITIVKTLSTNTKELILQSLKNPGKDIPLTSAAEVSQLANAQKVLNLMKVGADSKRINTKSVTRTITVYKGYSNTWDYGNEGMVLSKDTLISNTNMPGWVAVNIPSSGNIAAGTDGIAKFKGYLEEGANLQNVPNNQVQISQTWIFNEWATDIYEVV